MWSRLLRIRAAELFKAGHHVISSLIYFKQVEYRQMKSE